MNPRVQAIQDCIAIVENTPLGYRTEEEHEKLDIFASRIISEMNKLLMQEPEIQSKIKEWMSNR